MLSSITFTIKIIVSIFEKYLAKKMCFLARKYMAKLIMIIIADITRDILSLSAFFR